jgi:hypothetical protein
MDGLNVVPELQDMNSFEADLHRAAGLDNDLENRLAYLKDYILSK